MVSVRSVWTTILSGTDPIQLIGSIMKQTIFILLFMISSAISCGQINLSNGLIACYPFDGNTTDATGNGNDGSNQGATLTIDRFGNSNSAYLFDGIDDFIRVDSSIISSGENSICFWSKTNSFKSQTVVSLSPDIITDRLGIHINYDHNGDTAIFWDHGNIFNDGRLFAVSLPFITQWEHYVFIASVSNNFMRIYRNGSLHYATAYSDMISDTTRATYIGSGDGDFFFDGAMDDIRFYHRALSHAEVALLYQTTTCLPITTEIETIHQETEDLTLIYPNPTSGSINVSNGYRSLTVYSVTGEAIMTYSNNEQIDISTLIPGIYMINVDGNYKKVVKR